MMFPRLNSRQIKGISAALFSAVVLGLPPIFGKQAILEGAAPLTVVMLRTTLSMGLLWLAYLAFWRKYLYIYPVGLIGCMLAGLFNGLGSLMYYDGLGRLNASLVQLIFTLYTIFLTLLSRLDGHPITRFTVFRLGLGLAAVFLITGTGTAQVDWLGVLFVLISGAMYALHVAVNQHILYDVPAPTVALYTITAMALTVSAAYLMGGLPPLPATRAGWEFIVLLTVVTVLSRLALFTSVKYLGGVQAALIGLSEALITITIAAMVLDEKLSLTQWAGAAMLGASVLLIAREKDLGVLPQPKPWFQILAAWQARRQLPSLPPAPSSHPPPAEPGD